MAQPALGWENRKADCDPLQHQGDVNSAQFSPDGQRIVTASMDHTARLWDIPTVSAIDTREDVHLLIELAEAMAGVALSTPGQRPYGNKNNSRTETFHVVSAERVNTTLTNRRQIQGGILKINATPEFLKWSVTAKRSRTISPFSLTTFDRMDEAHDRERNTR